MEVQEIALLGELDNFLDDNIALLSYQSEAFEMKC